MKEDDDEDEETSGTTRYPTLPSLIALQQMRNRLGMAHDGRRLMKWSASATRRELIKVAAQLDIAYSSFADDVGDAFMLLARCRYFYPNMNKMVLEMNTRQACVTVDRTTKNVAGCRSYLYEIKEICPDSFPCLGIDKGGEAILEAKRTWRKLVLRMINILQVRKNFEAFDECHRAASKKANVLGKVIIPRTSMTIRYILSELEELEREEFFRLKKVLEVKYKHKKKAEKPPETEKEEKKVRLPPEPSPVIKEPPVVKPPPPPPPPRPPPPVVKPPPLPPRPPPEIICIVCGGPMHPKIKKPLTAEEIEQENAAIKELKESLSKVLNATEEYERKIDKKDSFKEFKQITSDLREKLQLLPPIPVIPDKVDVEKLCDICKELRNKKSAKKCIVCGDCLVDKDDKTMAVAKESKRKLQQQLDTILNLVREYENQGLADDKIEDFKQTASELKVKLKGPPIPCDVDVRRLCISCTDRYNEPATPEPEVKKPKMKASKASTTIASTQKTKESSTRSSSAQPTPTESDVTLGVFETEEITEIVQVFNPDGTVSEKRREVKIKRKLEDRSSQYDDQGPSGSASFRDKKNVGLVSIIYPRKMRERLKVIDKTVIGLSMSNRMIKDCVSSTFDLGFEDILESNELTPMPRDDVSLDSSQSIDTRSTNSSEYNSTNSFGDARSTQEVKNNSDDSVADSEVTNDKLSEWNT